MLTVCLKLPYEFAIMTVKWTSGLRPSKLKTSLCLINPLNAELNPICYLLTLLGAHLFLMFLDHTQRRTTVGRTPLDE